MGKNALSLGYSSYTRNWVFIFFLFSFLNLNMGCGVFFYFLFFWVGMFLFDLYVGVYFRGIGAFFL